MTAGFTHGLSAYHNQKCRCPVCRQANNAYMRAYNAIRRQGIKGGISGPIRDWARAHGYHVADRGSIPRAVADAYQAAHPTPGERS